MNVKPYYYFQSIWGGLAYPEPGGNDEFHEVLAKIKQATQTQESADGASEKARPPEADLPFPTSYGWAYLVSRERWNRSFETDSPLELGVWMLTSDDSSPEYIKKVRDYLISHQDGVDSFNGGSIADFLGDLEDFVVLFQEVNGLDKEGTLPTILDFLIKAEEKGQSFNQVYDVLAKIHNAAHFGLLPEGMDGKSLLNMYIEGLFGDEDQEAWDDLMKMIDELGAKALKIANGEEASSFEPV